MSETTQRKNKQKKQVRFNKRGNGALEKEYENGNNDNNQKIFASLA